MQKIQVRTNSFMQSALLLLSSNQNLSFHGKSNTTNRNHGLLSEYPQQLQWIWINEDWRSANQRRFETTHLRTFWGCCKHSNHKWRKTTWKHWNDHSHSQVCNIFKCMHSFSCFDQSLTISNHCWSWWSSSQAPIWREQGWAVGIRDLWCGGNSLEERNCEVCWWGMDHGIEEWNNGIHASFTCLILVSQGLQHTTWAIWTLLSFTKRFWKHGTMLKHLQHCLQEETNRRGNWSKRALHDLCRLFV